MTFQVTYSSDWESPPSASYSMQLAPMLSFDSHWISKKSMMSFQINFSSNCILYAMHKMWNCSYLLDFTIKYHHITASCYLPVNLNWNINYQWFQCSFSFPCMIEVNQMHPISLFLFTYRFLFIGNIMPCRCIVAPIVSYAYIECWIVIFAWS